MEKHSGTWLDTEIVSYWDKRSGSYSRGILDELEDQRHKAWQRVLAGICAPLVKERPGEALRVLDLGCGPGFFTVLFAQARCKVSAVDVSPEMLERARENVRAEAPGQDVLFHCGDVSELPFKSESFDLAVNRNVTWLMRDPEKTYAEWLRVLRPGGTLAVFDANWCRYLVDPALDEQRHRDQEQDQPEEEDARATLAEEKRCEEIAAELPLTPVLRPEWDVQALERLGASNIVANTEIWRELWTPNEHAYYATSPLFLVQANK